MSRAITFCALAFAVAAAPVPVRAQWVSLDQFDRLDGPIVPSDGWTQHTPPYLYFEVLGAQATSPLGADALMTYDAYHVDDGPLRFDLHHSGGTAFQSASAILGLLDSDNFLKIEMISNANTGKFHSLLFRYEDAGTLGYGWDGITPASYFVYLGGLAFSDAQITAGLVGGLVTVQIDTDFNDLTPPIVYTRSGAPVENLGSAVGLAVSGASEIDNFKGLPEPGSAMLFLLLGGSAVWAIRRRHTVSAQPARRGLS